MRHSSQRTSCALALTLLLAGCLQAQEASPYELLGESTQAAIWIPDAQEMVDGWERTELARLASDKEVAPFFEEKRKEIENRLMEAGWRLNIKPDDLEGFVTGQLLLGWSASPRVEAPAVDEEAAKDAPPKFKPQYWLQLVADIDRDAAKNKQLLEKIDTQLKQQKAEKARLEHNGIDVIKYILPRRPGGYIKPTSFVAIHEGKLLAADNEDGIKDLIDRLTGKATSPTLLNDHDFAESRKLAKISGEAHLEFFVRPLGFARVIRSIAGRNSKSGADMLVALENQGFTGIRAVSGEVIFGGKDLDVEYKGFVFADKPLEKSAKLLDFPNKALTSVPSFVGENIASYLSSNWNASEAFWAAEGLVDELAGAADFFKELIEALKSDPSGPQIDVRASLPLFTNDIIAITDAKEGEADVDSRRNMMAFKLKDPAKIAETLNNAMKKEPDARLVDFDGHVIWEKNPEQPEFEGFPGEDFPSDFGDDFGSDFGGQPAGQAPEANQWLNSWAITVYGDYLMFGSHTEIIKEAIVRSRSVEQSPLLGNAEYQRTLAAIDEFHGAAPKCSWRVLLPKQAYRIQYELFRQGKLSQSESMLSSILDRLVQEDEEQEIKEQKIQGDGLPTFSKIEGYLQPGGFSVRTENAGWSFGGMSLSKNWDKKKAPEAILGQATIETARPSQVTEATTR